MDSVTSRITTDLHAFSLTPTYRVQALGVKPSVTIGSFHIIRAMEPWMWPHTVTGMVSESWKM